MHERSKEESLQRSGLVRRVARAFPLFGRLAISRVGNLEAARVALERNHEELGVRVAELQETVLTQQHNHELLKGELWDTRVQITEFARRLSTDATLLTAGAKLADLRDAVSALERRMRGIERPPAPASAGSAPTAGSPAPDEVATSGRATSEITSTLFDYVGFERRFRGDPDAINAVLHERYAGVLRDHQPVVDIGCGRGELLELLAREGIQVIGVEPDPGMAAEARARGITVHEMVADEYFATVPDGTLGAVISTHVVEHLPLDVLVGFLERSAEKLRPGGVFIAETPNPATLLVLGTHFIMDPTHVWPLHPDLLVFLCESAGFRDVRAEFFSPADTMHLPLSDGTAEEEGPLGRRVDEAFARLNHVLFGPQDYAVFATRGAAAETGEGASEADAVAIS